VRAAHRSVVGVGAKFLEAQDLSVDGQSNLFSRAVGAITFNLAIQPEPKGQAGSRGTPSELAAPLNMPQRFARGGRRWPLLQPEAPM
jgi:hypothetical protein